MMFSFNESFKFYFREYVTPRKYCTFEKGRKDPLSSFLLFIYRKKLHFKFTQWSYLFSLAACPSNVWAPAVTFFPSDDGLQSSKYLNCFCLAQTCIFLRLQPLPWDYWGDARQASFVLCCTWWSSNRCTSSTDWSSSGTCKLYKVYFSLLK